MPRASYLKIVQGTYYYQRRVPARFAHLDKRRFVRKSLETRDIAIAQKKSEAMSHQIEAYWAALEDGSAEDAAARFEAAERIARQQSFRYKTAEELIDANSIDEILERIKRLIELTPAGTPPAAELGDALLGLVAKPKFKISDAFAFYFENAGDKIASKSPNQIKLWNRVRKAAADGLVESVGDIEFDQLSDTDILWQWREYLWDRVQKKEIVAETANKQIHYVSAMLRDVAKKKRLSLPDLSFMRFKAGKNEERTPYTVEQITSLFLKGDRLSGMNTEARRVLLAMIETGMRPIEICSLRPEHIHLGGPIPYVNVTPGEDYELKTESSKREIPLVGASLAAFQAQPDGFPHYRDRNASLSATVNKYLLENGLRPTKRHSLYSLRHAFEDRLSESNIPDAKDDRFRAALFGHAYKERESYGKGPSLERKHRVLEQIALPTPELV